MLSRRTIRGPETGFFHTAVCTVLPCQIRSCGMPTFTDSKLPARWSEVTTGSTPHRKLTRHRGAVELLDAGGDLFQAVLHGEVARVQPDQGGAGEVAQVGLAARGGEENVALAPEDDRVGLGCPKALLPCRVQRSIGAVVVQQIQLDAVRVRTCQEEQVHVPVVRADLRRVRVTGQVDALDGLGLEERLEGRLGL